MSTDLSIIHLDQEETIAACVEEAASVIASGGVVAVPTETTYGLLVRADQQSSRQRLVHLKRRAPTVAMAVFARDREHLFTLGKRTKNAEILVDNLLPGPLTLVLENQSALSMPVVVDGRIGLRWSSHEFLQRLVAKLEFPVTATSANVSGRGGEHDPDQIVADLGAGIDLLVDAGRLESKPSTVVDCSRDEPEILRHGVISADVIRQLLQKKRT